MFVLTLERSRAAMSQPLGFPTLIERSVADPAQDFRWLWRWGNTRSHTEHGS